MLKVRSKFLVAIATAISVVVLIACYAVQTKSAAAQVGTSTVRDMPALVAALKSARGGETILLAPGAYATLGLRGVNVPGAGVTIASADASSPAVVAGMEFDNCSGLTFRYLEVTLNTRTQTVLNVVNSKNIHLDRLNIHAETASKKSGVLFRNSSNVSVKNSKFHDIGTAVRNVDSTHVTVSGNRFYEIRGDGVQSSGTSYVTIAANHFTDFRTAPGDHPDAIQFFTLNQKAPARDITVIDNVIVRGAGDVVQGIFLGNEINMPYVNVKIVGNKVIGAMYNGIAVGGGQNVTISGNIVQAYRGQDSWIIIAKSTNSVISDNQAFALIHDRGNVGLTLKSNKKLKAAKVGDISMLTAPLGDK